MDESEAMRIIEEYLNEFSKYLPEDNKEELIEELRQHLIDLASENGPMTVESARRAVRIMGDPRKLASEFSRDLKRDEERKTFGFSFRIGEKEYRFDFSIDKDLAKTLYDFMYFLIIVIIVSGILRVLHGLTNPGSFSVLGAIADTLVSVLLIVLFMHIIMALFSYQPSEYKKESKKVYKQKVERIVKKKYVKAKTKSEENITLKASGLFLSGAFGIIFGIIFAVFATEVTSFTFVTMMLWLSLGLVLIFGGTIEILRAFYLVIEGKDSYFLEAVKSLSGLFLIPAFFLIDIYTEQLQIAWIRDIEHLDNVKSFEDFLAHIEVMFVPHEYLVLAKIISIILILLIFAYAVMVILKYKSTRPKSIFDIVATQ